MARKASSAKAKLKTYRAKRDFQKTSEPSGERAVAAAPHPRFVIQKHDATRLHYDLRLEVDGVFKSWAVTKGPSLDPHDKRLAVEVEDHPLDYGDFEGTIPEGEYGAGTVMLWDRGYWESEDGDAAKALRAGTLKFVLTGDKLQGGYVLTRMPRREREKRNNWLLIKRRDDYAADDGEARVDDTHSVASGRTMDQIEAGKGRKPKPFMLKKNGSAKAVWHSSKPGGRTAHNPTRGRTKHAAESQIEIRGVTISKADKALWPASRGEEAITKADLAAYYDTVGEWMLPHLEGRPCSVIRAPDGIRGERFFQRHLMKGAPDVITRAKVRGVPEPYVQFDSVEAIVAAAQIAVLELHPWNSRPGDPETPSRIVFDLDPAPDVAFDAVVAAAHELRERIEAVGLASFCKTTGGKGMHVVAPFKASRGSRVSWRDAKTFAHQMCREMAADSPDLYVVTMAKRARVGKIFLDYLRNDRMATAVAPLSPRAREGATVSMPLTWAQARRGLDPARFTIRSAPALLKKAKPWADYRDAERPFQAAAKKLLGKRER
jgi:bifunctional non-homologous end joining protein LigD